MFAAMVLAALLIDGVFSALGLVPTGPRPSRAAVFGHLGVDYTLFLNLLAAVVFVSLFWLTRARGATDPVCGMRVDRAKAVGRELAGQRFFFCSEHCARSFEREAAATG
jgi:YHS domain-containing protein